MPREVGYDATRRDALVTRIGKMRVANGVRRWWKLAAARLPLLGRIEKEV